MVMSMVVHDGAGIISSQLEQPAQDGCRIRDTWRHNSIRCQQSYRLPGNITHRRWRTDYRQCSGTDWPIQKHQTYGPRLYLKRDDRARGRIVTSYNP
jgi:hypothetical protein